METILCSHKDFQLIKNRFGELYFRSIDSGFYVRITHYDLPNLKNFVSGQERFFVSHETFDCDSWKTIDFWRVETGVEIRLFKVSPEEYYRVEYMLSETEYLLLIEIIFHQLDAS